MLRLLSVAFLLASTSAVAGQTTVVDWSTVRDALERDQVEIDLSETYREQMEAYRRQVETYRTEIAALSEVSELPLQSGLPTISEELPVISVVMERNTRTPERHGLFRVRWDQREIANVDLLEINTNLYVVVGVNGSLSLKAPLGAWRLEKEGVPDFYPEDLRPGRSLIRGDVRGDLR